MAKNVETREVDVLVVGGGCSGVAAAVHAGRSAVRVLLCEEGPWLGGTLTAAGASAFDGNDGALGGGVFGEFRAAMREHYGGSAAPGSSTGTNTGATTRFEPQVAAKWFADTVSQTRAEVVHGARLRRVLREQDDILGAIFEVEGELLEVRASVTIEATEYGDVLEMGGVPYRLGRESAEETGEPSAPLQADDEIQDLTMVATLRRFDGRAPVVPLPIGFDKSRFDCSTGVLCSNPDPEYWNHPLHDWESFVEHAQLPNGLLMLNWPYHANDFPAIGLFGSPQERAWTIAKAKERTLAFVHYIQHELGHPEWGLAGGVYPTEDGLPLQPVVRESRRVVPVRWMREQDVVPQDGSDRNPVLEEGVAVGDHAFDHRHEKWHRPPRERLGESYPKNAPFQVPYSAMVPRTVDGLVVAGRNIGATHVVNGCTRHEPVSMAIGQAAGAAAASTILASEPNPRAIYPQTVQQEVLDFGCQVVPDPGCPATEPDFEKRQLALLESR